MMKAPINIFLIPALLLALNSATYSKISERTLKNYSSIFVSRLVHENIIYQDTIHRVMNGLLTEGHAGIRLADRFGSFLRDCDTKGIHLTESKFIHGNDRFSIFLVLADKSDGQGYTLYLEYDYKRRQRTCNLRSVYFSILFNDKLPEIKKYFEAR